MKLRHLTLAAASLVALAACNKSGDQGNTSGDAVSTPISNSAGSYAPDTNSVPGTNGDATGVGATGVSPNDVRNAPTPDTVVPPAQAMEPTAPVGPTP